MKLFFATVTLLLVFTSHIFAQELKIGDKAPAFKTVSDDGSEWNSADYVGKHFIVVYFYPAAMTGGCTQQACTYRDYKSQINAADAVVIGISGDSVEGLSLFKKAHNLNFTLLSDESGEIAAKFGVPTRDGGKITREVDGQNFDFVRGSTASRWTFIIDKNGKIVYRNTQVDVNNDPKEILEFIKNNS